MLQGGVYLDRQILWRILGKSCDLIVSFSITAAVIMSVYFDTKQKEKGKGMISKIPSKRV
jgi:hypothetical protein